MHWIQVSPHQLYAAAARYREAAREVRRSARRIRQTLNATTWQGVSRHRFEDHLQEWEWEAERAAGALESIAEQLTIVAHAFEEADRMAE